MLRRKREEGHSLVELIIAIVILGFALLGLFSLFFNIAIGNVQARYRTTATVLAQALIEEIKSKEFDEFSQKNGAGNWSVIGVDTGETLSSRTGIDDVDDYSGLSESLASPYSGYSRAVSVIYVAPTDLDTASTRDQSYKRVNVTVNRGGANYSSLVTVITPVREEPT